MTSIDRRMLLTRGAIGGAALTLTSGAALASVSEDAEVIRRGNECLGHIADTARLAKPKKEAYSKVWAGVKRKPRWQVMHVCFNQPDNSWYAKARDFWKMTNNPPVCHMFPLSAQTEATAEREAVELDGKFNRDFDALFDVVSKRVGREKLYDAWCAELNKLDGKLRSLAKTPAVTPKGFRMKAAVILAAERAFEEDPEEFWRLEDLRDSLMADLA